MGDKILSIFGVAPFAGAWIEMNLAQRLMQSNASLPLRERELKFSMIIFWS